MTPAAAPACAFGAAETATESNGPVLKPKPTPIDKKANSIKTMSAVRESVERASSPRPISANPHVMIRRAPNRVASLPDFKETRKKASDTGSICNPTAVADAPWTACRNKGIRNSIAYMPNVMPAAATEAAENARERKIDAKLGQEIRAGRRHFACFVAEYDELPLGQSLGKPDTEQAGDVIVAGASIP